MKIIFMGTPQFAVPILETLYHHHDIVLVVTQPDSYHPRKKTFLAPPVKTWALNHGLKVFQPEKIRQETQAILDFEADFIVTAAYGQIIPKAILAHPKYLPINVHGSLLPKYRGGAPIQRAIMNGETKTGITIMIMAPKMDAGDILLQKEVLITDSDTSDTIFEKLSILGSEMILGVLDGVKAGNIHPVKQNPDEASYAPNLTKEDEKLDFHKSARVLFNQIRGLNSNPGAYFSLDGENIKVYNSRVSEKSCFGIPGRIVSVTKDSFEVCCGNNTVLSITEIQFPSKKRTLVRDFLNGIGKKIIYAEKEIK